MKLPGRTWHIKQVRGSYEVYDPEGRFRLRYDTRAEAETYIAERIAARRRNDQRHAQEAAR